MKIKVDMINGTLEVDSTGIMFSNNTVLVMTADNGYSKLDAENIEKISIMPRDVQTVPVVDKIQKIKIIRELLHCSLLDAKNIVEDTHRRAD